MSSEQDAVERLPVDTIRGRLRLEVNRFDTKMHMTNRDVSLRQTLMQAEQALEASQQENERWQEFGRKINEKGHEAGQGDWWVFPMKYFNTLLNMLQEQVKETDGRWDQQADFEEGDAKPPWDSESGVDEFPNLIMGEGLDLPRHMAVDLPYSRLWHSAYKARHPDCSRSDWELCVYHNTPDEQYLALHCGNCGKTVDPAEIINALIAHMEES